MIPGRFEESGSSTDAPVEHPRHVVWFHLAYDCRGLLHKGEDYEDVLLRLEGAQVYGFRVCLLD